MKNVMMIVLFCLTAGLAASTPEWNFTLEKGELHVTASLPANEYLYRKTTSVTLTADGKTVAPASSPETVPHEDEISGKTEIYPGGRELVWVFRSKQWIFPLKLEVKWQGCSKGTAEEPGVCFLPGSGVMTLKEFRAVPNPVPMTFGEAKSETPQAVSGNFPAFEILRTASGYLDAPRFVRFLKGENAEAPALPAAGFWGILLLTFLGGIALNLTPCVLPMIPVNLAIIGARDGTRRSCILRGLTYGAGIAVSYGVLGIIVVLTGSRFGVIDSFWWFNALIALLFIGLGLSLFDVFIFDLSRFSSNIPGLSGARYAGIFLMGAVAALLAGACVAPVVVAALIQAGTLYNSGETAGLFLPLVLGLGMAFPWPLLAGGFAVLPKPGAWMKYVKYAFGTVIILLGVYYGYLAYAIAAARPETPAKSIAALEDALRQSAREKKPVLLDFRAEWCKNCKAMERTTFHDPTVVSELKNFLFVKFDATDISDPEISAVLKKFGVSGLPAYLVVQGK
ncbi:MAG: thioredoxin family protein [Lentisphaeria bacterium]|nr:thioredoxin family protein [Lentisphaeria bacterium]